MMDPKSRFIAAAIRPFGKQSESKLAARAWLEGSVRENDPRLDEATRRLESRKRRGLNWRIVLFGLIMLISEVFAFTLWSDTVEHVRWAPYLVNPESGSAPPGSRERVYKSLSDSDKMLFLDKAAGGGGAAGAEALWKSEPENPAYFAEYARAAVGENRVALPDYLDTARRLAPENAWFTYYAAETEAERVATLDSTGNWKRMSPEQMDSILALLRQAREQRDYQTYGAEMLGRRLAAIPQRNLPEALDAQVMLMESGLSISSNFKRLVATIYGRSWRTAEAGDVDGFRQNVLDGEHLLRGMCGDRGDTLMNEVILARYVSFICQRFGEDAKKLGLTEESERWSRITLPFVMNGGGRSSRRIMLDGRAVDPQESGSLAMGVSLGMAKNLVTAKAPLTRADLKPGRMMDHALFSRLLSIVSWVVMAVALAGTALYRFRVPAMPCGLARRAVELLDRRDVAWIVGAGVLLPFGFVMAINHLTPLGGHDYGLKATGLLLPAVHFLGLWLLWFTVPPQIARWRLAKRAGLMGLSDASRLGWGMVGIAFAFVPLAGWAAVSRSYAGFWKNWLAGEGIEIVAADVSPVRFWLAAGLALILIAGCIWRALSSLLRMRDLIPATAVSLVLTPVFCDTLLIAALTVPAFKASGQYWFGRDMLFRPDPAAPGWSAYEARIAAQARKELREAIGDGF